MAKSQLNGIPIGNMVMQVMANTAPLQQGLQVAQTHIQTFVNQSGNVLANKMSVTFKQVAQNAQTSLFEVARGAAVMGGVFGGVGTAIMGMFSGAQEEFADFDKVMTSAAIASTDFGGSIDTAKGKIKDLAIELGISTSFSAKEAAESLRELALRGFDVVKASAKDIRPIMDMAVATNENLSTATNLATSTMNTFQMTLKDGSHIADVYALAANKSAAGLDFFNTAFAYIGPVAAAANIKFEDMAAILATLSDRGIRASMAGTSMRQLLSTLLKPSDEFIGQLARLGLTYDDISPRTHRLTQIFDTLRRSGADAQTMFEMFRITAAPAANVMLSIDRNGQYVTKTIDELSKTLQNAHGVTAKLAQEQLKNLPGILDVLNDSFTALKLTIGESLSPVIAVLAQGMTFIINKLREFIEAHPVVSRAIFIFIAAIGALAAILAPIMLAMSAFMFALPTITAIIGAIGAPILIVAGAVGALIAVVTSLVAYFWSDIQGMIQAFSFGFENFNETLENTITDHNLMFVIGTKLGKLWRELQLIWGAFVAGFEGIDETSEQVGTLQAAFNWLGEAVRYVWDKGVAVVEWLAGPFTETFKVVWSLLKISLTNGLTWWGEFFGGIWGWIKKVFTNILPSEGGWISEAIDAFYSLGDAVWSSLAGPLEWVWNKLKGIAEWIQNLASSASDFIGGGLFNAAQSVGVPGLATGGMVTKSGLAMVGERGRELRFLNRGDAIMSNDKTEALLAGAGGISVNISGPVTVRNDQDIIKVSRSFYEMVNDERRRRGV